MSSPAERARAAGWTRIPDDAVAAGWWYRSTQRVVWMTNDGRWWWRRHFSDPPHPVGSEDEALVAALAILAPEVEPKESTAERLAAHPRWMWPAGMACLPTYVGEAAASPGTHGVAACRMQADGCWVTESDAAVEDSYDACPVQPVPWLSDPATAGCLLEMLRIECSDWHGTMAMGPHGHDGAWSIWDFHRNGWAGDGIEVRGENLGEACALALLAVWGTP